MPTKAQIRRRRATALAAAALATGAIWALFLRGEGGDGGASEESRASGVSAPVDALARRMTPEDRVDQILLLGFEGTDATSPVVDQLRARQVGGLLIGPGNWLDATQGAALIAELRAAGLAGGRIPPLLTVAQEGGRYRALADLPPTQRQLDIGDQGSARFAERWSLAANSALRNLGVDLDLFPVADVATLDSPIADRAFSEDPAVAAAMTAAAVRGCGEARIACAALHFPGLGGASQDTDEGPATVSLSSAELADRDLAAFRAAFAERVPAVVLSLAFYAAYDPVTPAAMSSAVATDLLRGQLEYTGAAITDDLGAGAIKAISNVPDAAVAAIQAGADMVQVESVRDQAGVREALLDAVASGQIPEERLDEAVGRVLELKRRAGLLKGNL
jgi:beta-N-acetylhexosaminidase